MSNSSALKSSTSKAALFEKVSSEPIAFVDFILTLRVTTSPRGDLIALIKTLINARAFPPIATWPDLYRFMIARRATPDTINEARKLWSQYKSAQSINRSDVPRCNSKKGPSPWTTQSRG
jgi:hypothetical protein